MPIDSESTLSDIYYYNPYILSDAQESQLKNITLSTNHIIGVGLAGFDLAGVYADCAIATDNCSAATYNSFDGYAFVAMIYDDSTDDSASIGACLPDLTCFTLNREGEYYLFNTLVTSAAASASVPASMTTDAVAAYKCMANTGGFDD